MEKRALSKSVLLRLMSANSHSSSYAFGNRPPIGSCLFSTNSHLAIKFTEAEIRALGLRYGTR